MIVTEQDARQRWCPFARIARREVLDRVYGVNQMVVVGSVNRDALGDGGSQPASCRCISSGCMAWVPLQAKGQGMGKCGLIGAHNDA